ncbi:MAG: NUDIX hydrolase [Vicinamibacteria bacterium]|nr:NUDIX hydrolase [Vicinamibacteria bacterium]
MKIVYEGPVFSVESGILAEPGGVRARRDIVRHSSSVAILPVHADKRITLVTQYRCAFRQQIIELPAGRIDRGETPLQAAKRELREELGLGARRWERLQRILPSPGYSDEAVTIFRATELFESPGTPDPDERIKPITMPLSSAVKLMRLRRIQDAKTVVALLQEKKRRSKSPVPPR